MFNVPSFFGFKSVFSGGFTSEYQAILNTATLSGYTLPSASQQILQNQLIVDLKSAGYWNRFDTFTMFATDGDEDFALLDWKRLINYTAINSPTFFPNQGFLGNGSSAYIDTNFTPSIDGVQYTLNNAGFSVYIYQPASTQGKYLVANNNTGDPSIRMRTHNNPSQVIDGQMNSNVTTVVQGINSNQVGHYHLDRIASNSFRYQMNSTEGNPYNQSSSGLPSFTTWILRITTQYADTGVSYFIGRSGFTKAEKDNLNSIIDNYLTAI